ncbi:uncharacterized protein VTP21DRAFT_7549 [Calcarisporiella thermophila]|uniref:uncharacterized protein n=1 Tax=Calcarisporiella thermophila TaxID=911321 RepID=UPI0037425FA3
MEDEQVELVQLHSPTKSPSDHLRMSISDKNSRNLIPIKAKKKGPPRGTIIEIPTTEPKEVLFEQSRQFRKRKTNSPYQFKSGSEFTSGVRDESKAEVIGLIRPYPQSSTVSRYFSSSNERTPPSSIPTISLLSGERGTSYSSDMTGNKRLRTIGQISHRPKSPLSKYDKVKDDIESDFNSPTKGSRTRNADLGSKDLPEEPECVILESEDEMKVETRGKSKGDLPSTISPDFASSSESRNNQGITSRGSAFGLNADRSPSLRVLKQQPRRSLEFHSTSLVSSPPRPMKLIDRMKGKETPVLTKTNSNTSKRKYSTSSDGEPSSSAKLDSLSKPILSSDPVRLSVGTNTSLSALDSDNMKKVITEPSTKIEGDTWKERGGDLEREEDKLKTNTKEESDKAVKTRPVFGRMRRYNTRNQARLGMESSTNMPLFTYPFTGFGGVTLTQEDAGRLNDGEFLNDNIIEFYLGWFREKLEKQNKKLADKVHIFNSFFYRRLTQGKTTDAREMYSRVRKWTAKVDLFQKNYIFVPINESLHWYLILICNPRLFLPGEQSAIELDEDEDEKFHLDMDEDLMVTGDSSSSDPDPSSRRSSIELTSAPVKRDVMEIDSGSPSLPAADQGGSQSGVKNPTEAASGSRGDRMEEDREKEKEKEKEDGEERVPCTPSSVRSASPCPDVDEETGLLDSPGSPKRPPQPKPRRITRETAQKQNDQDDALPTIANATLAAMRAFGECDGGSAVKSEGVGRANKRIWRNPQESPFIICFDSLGTTHPTVFTNLNRYLMCEASERLKVNTSVKIPGIYAKVPTQNNHCDCGIFLLHYVETFLSDPRKYLDMLVNKVDKEHEWQPRKIHTKRRRIQELMFKMAEEYQIYLATKASQDDLAKRKKREGEGAEESKKEEGKATERKDEEQNEHSRSDVGGG